MNSSLSSSYLTLTLAIGAMSAPQASAQFALGEGPAAELYEQNCASCHGENAAGGGASSLIDDVWDYGASDAEIFQIIDEGAPLAGMPAYGATMSDEQIRSLVIYLREARYLAEGQRISAETPPQDGERSTQHHDFAFETVLQHQGMLWSVEFLPDGRMVASDRGGDLLLINPDGQVVTVTGVPDVWAFGQGGLLDIGVHPDHAENGWIYLSFSHAIEVDGEERGMTKIVRGRIRDGAWVDEELIFEAPEQSYLPTRHHFGTRLVFSDGYVFFGIGDRGRQDMAQDLSVPNGKIHRIHDDGRIPQDNPFLDQDGAFPTIWTYGNRNPQGLVLHPNGNLYETEHGPRGGDELNLIVRGANYGWPIATFGMNYSGTPITSNITAPGVTDPVWQWTPVIAACGLTVGAGEAFPQWRGDLFAGGLSAELVQRIRLGENGEVIERENILKGEGRVRDVITGPGGDLYVIINGGRRDDTQSWVMRLSPAEDEA